MWPYHSVFDGSVSIPTDSETASRYRAGTTPVQLGRQNDDGTTTPGTTLSMVVEDDAPQFTSDALPNTSQPAAFEIRTGEFSNTKAKKGTISPAFFPFWPCLRVLTCF